MRQILAILLSALMLLPSSAIACSCLSSATVQEEKEQSSRVFLGHVAAIEVLRSPDRDRPYKIVTFAVSETFKGSPVHKLQVSTGMGNGDCGYFFDSGREYVVYASGEDDHLVTSYCSLTGLASDSRSGLAILRGGS